MSDGSPPDGHPSAFHYRQALESIVAVSMDALRGAAKVDPYSLPCVGCKRDVASVEGPSYPSDEGILCGDCGAKVEATHWNEVITKRDGGPT